MNAWLPKKLPFQDYVKLCSKELQELYDCLYDTPKEREAMPFHEWAESKYKLHMKSKFYKNTIT